MYNIKKVVEKTVMDTAILYKMADGTEYLSFPTSPTAKIEVKAEVKIESKPAEVKAEVKPAEVKPEAKLLIKSQNMSKGQHDAYAEIDSGRIIGLYVNTDNEVKWIDYRFYEKHITKETYRVAATACYSTLRLTGYLKFADNTKQAYIKGKAVSMNQLEDVGYTHLQDFDMNAPLREKQKYVAHHYDRLRKAL
jgi:hypothetical protein